MMPMRPHAQTQAHTDRQTETEARTVEDMWRLGTEKNRESGSNIESPQSELQKPLLQCSDLTVLGRFQSRPRAISDVSYTPICLPPRGTCLPLPCHVFLHSLNSQVRATRVTVQHLSVPDTSVWGWPFHAFSGNTGKMS